MSGVLTSAARGVATLRREQRGCSAAVEWSALGSGLRVCADCGVARRAGGGRAARWAPISSGEPRAAALHLYDNYFLFVFVEESTRLAGRRFSEPSSIVVN